MQAHRSHNGFMRVLLVAELRVVPDATLGRVIGRLLDLAAIGHDAPGAGQSLRRQCPNTGGCSCPPGWPAAAGDPTWIVVPRRPDRPTFSPQKSAECFAYGGLATVAKSSSLRA